MDNDLDVEAFFTHCTFPESFWHTNNSIFDVNVHYKGEFVGMVSFSKNNTRWWEQANKDDVWAPWTPTFKDPEELLLYKMKQRKMLIDKLMTAAKKIKECNELK